MLQAKTLGVLLIVALIPVLVSLPWWLWCGLGAGQIAGAAFETALVMMLVAIPGALMAVLTDSFPRALLWSFLLFAIVIFMSGFFTIVSAANHIRSFDEMSFVVSRAI